MFVKDMGERNEDATYCTHSTEVYTCQRLNFLKQIYTALSSECRHHDASVIGPRTAAQVTVCGNEIGCGVGF